LKIYTVIIAEMYLNFKRYLIFFSSRSLKFKTEAIETASAL